MKTPFKHLIGLLTCAVIVSAIGVSFAVASGVGFISKEELKPLIGNDGVVILDARRGRDWSSSEFKIKGALRAAPDDFSQWSSNYPKTKKIVLYCA